MKKVGIITFHRAENFGAVMQVYALQETLRALGVEAFVIDYRNSQIEAQYHILNPAILWSRKNVYISLKSYVGRFSSLKTRRIKKQGYQDFRSKYLNVAKPEIWKNCDLLITGSDQVWNLHLTGGFDEYYFLDFPALAGQKRISYAASSDKDPDDLLYREKEKVQAALLKFDAISVREDFLKDSLTRFINREIEVSLDPTLLLDVAKYDDMAERPVETGYVCVYHMTPTEEGRKLAERIASERNLKVIELFGGYEVYNSNNICKTNLSPTQLLGYLKYADEIVTTSFHGIAFSVKFQKNFWVIDKGDNFRQKNLLSLLGLSDRLVKSGKVVELQSIDYLKVDSKLQPLVDLSISYVSQWLK